MATARIGGLMVAIGLAMWADIRPADAATWDNLCGGVAAQEAGFPSDPAILRAAELSEQWLRESTPSDDQLEALFALLQLAPSTDAPPTAEAIAHYCSAAGEAMRRASVGSQFQAQQYLMTGFRQAAEAGTADVASTAAYRFGLASAASPIGVGMRGGRAGGRRGSEVVVDEARQAQQVQDDPCIALDNIDLERTSNTFLSALALRCAAFAAERSGDPATSARASLRLARLDLAWSETSAADAAEFRSEGIETALAAIPIAQRIVDRELRSELVGRLIGTAIDLGAAADPRVASSLAALHSEMDGRSQGSSLAHALQARLDLMNGDDSAARSSIEQAILIETQKPLPARLPEYYLLLAAADRENERRHVFTAYTALENLRPLLPRLDPLTEETSFSLYMREVFERAADLQLADARQGDEEHVRAAQQIIEAFRQAELQSAVGSECLPPRQPLRPQDLRPGEAILYPVLLPDRIELLYISGDEIAQGAARFRRLPPNRTANRRDVARLVETLVLSLSYQQDEQWREPARQLYRLLIEPVEAQLQPGSMLAVIPDGPLRALPFATLLAADGQFLVQKTRLGVAPALAYLQPGRSDRSATLRVVAASLQRQMSLPAGNFPGLAATAAEARIAADSGNPGMLIEDFTKADLVAALERDEVDVLHLATHASFNGRSDRAFIVANGEVIRLPELREIIERNLTRGDSLDLLVLSACETAVGDDEASMGLAGATVQAGALSAIASLWQVDDVGTGELMRQFYSYYRDGASRSEALREAQLALIGSGGENSRPFVWAAFQLLGAWR